MEAINFLNLINLSLMDAYYSIIRNYIRSEDFDLEVPIFINSKGSQFLASKGTQENEVVGISEMHQHLARHIFVENQPA